MATSQKTNDRARPFLKWAGGKTQLLAQFAGYFPKELKRGQIQAYVEPFFGGGAVFLEIAQTYDITSAYLNDINAELILVYQVVQRDAADLIEHLYTHQQTYDALDEGGRLRHFYSVRDAYNEQRSRVDYSVYSDAWIQRAAYMIFLNKTCYNGLYRVNAKGKFNVPFGRYRRPVICDVANIQRVAQLLQIADLTIGRFTDCERHVDRCTFVYFDPPYRPISSTASFTAYSKYKFGDQEQLDLARFFVRLDERYGAKLMLSNSDPANIDPTDHFFEDLYARFNIHRVYANRMINSKAGRRGKISELLITNYS